MMVALIMVGVVAIAGGGAALIQHCFPEEEAPYAPLRHMTWEEEHEWRKNTFW